MTLKQAVAEVKDGKAEAASLPVDQRDLVVARRLHRGARPHVAVHQRLGNVAGRVLHRVDGLRDRARTAAASPRAPVPPRPAAAHARPGPPPADDAQRGLVPAVRPRPAPRRVQRPERRAKRAQLRQRRPDYIAGNARYSPSSATRPRRLRVRPSGSGPGAAPGNPRLRGRQACGRGRAASRTARFRAAGSVHREPARPPGTRG